MSNKTTEILTIESFPHKLPFKVVIVVQKNKPMIKVERIQPLCNVESNKQMPLLLNMFADSRRKKNFDIFKTFCYAFYLCEVEILERCIQGKLYNEIYKVPITAVIYRFSQSQMATNTNTNTNK